MKLITHIKNRSIRIVSTNPKAAYIETSGIRLVCPVAPTRGQTTIEIDGRHYFRGERIGPAIYSK